MKAQDIPHKVGTFFSELDMQEIGDELLRRANLQRRRPGTNAAAAIGLVGFGAIAAFAVVAFVPQVRSLFTGTNSVGDKAKRAAEGVADNAAKRATELKNEAMHVLHNGERTAAHKLDDAKRS